ncbi:cytochrome b/b6 domain-containing protein [uncultured Bdellovibrio sp.]|uniref:cytochrome b/b6 domain-containing protein n=1 Tax=Bdellovibrio sp. HCB-162 TaxID=3394234 RepID=UPI0025E26C6F|nr:cytochrome b/b6 domain-containing protein [uncultured Bdellovibrio sp.]
MRSTLVYDLPTRLFHWLFAGLFLVAFVLAKTSDDESIIFIYHMLAGLMLGGLVLWRIVWGVIGSKHAKFSGFNLNLFELKNYILGIISGSKKRWPGHNPASSWAAITMFILALGLAVSGYLMTTGNKETFEDIHEFMANTFMVVVGLHVTGVIFHSIRHQDRIALSMLDGKKEIPENSTSIRSSRSFAGLLLIAFVFAAGLYLYKHFDPSQRTLGGFGQTLQLDEIGKDGDDD